MNTAGRQDVVYTSGRWNVKPGNEKEFVRTWKEFATWTIKSKRGMIDARLLQEADDALRFISVGSWQDMDSVGEWRKTAEFKKFLAKLTDLCGEIQIRTLRSVLLVGGR